MGAEPVDGDGASGQDAGAEGLCHARLSGCHQGGISHRWRNGNGVLFRRGGVYGYYNTAGVSYGLQAGAQTFSYVMFFMNEWSWRALNSYGGLEVGVGPSVVVLDEGKARSITSATLTSDVYAFVFGQQGIMAGAGLQGTKITRINY